MGISARSLVSGLLAASLSSALNAAPTGSDCGFSIDLPAAVALKRDSDAPGATCLYRDASALPSPFVNSVTVYSWEQLSSLRVNGERLRDVGFFRFNGKSSISYLGRPSYADSRNSYEQRVTGKPSSLRRTSPEGTTSQVVRSELKVDWLKPVDARTQDETTENFSCVDAVVSSRSSVAVINWCLAKGQAETADLANAVMAMHLH